MNLYYFESHKAYTEMTMNSTVLMSGVEWFDDAAAINPFMDASMTIDREKALAEHDAIRTALEQAGVTVVKVDAPEKCQDGVYTANWALVRGDTAVLASLPNARKAEEAYAERVLSDLGKKVIHIPEGCRNGCTSSSCAFSRRGVERGVSVYDEVNAAAEKRAGAEELGRVGGSAGKQAQRCGPLRFSGQGDALPCGDYLFTGLGYRSDDAAQQFAADTLGFTRVALQTVPQMDEYGQAVVNTASGWPDSYFYDIDLALAILRSPDTSVIAPSYHKKGLIAWCPEAFTPESQEVLRSFDAVDKIEVSLEEAIEAFACNLVSTGETVIMSAHAPKFQAELEAHGFKVVTPPITELLKGGGYIRCTTLTLA